MRDQYAKGLAREAVAWHQRGHSISDICRSLRVSPEFVSQALATPHILVTEREYTPDYDSINRVGGY